MNIILILIILATVLTNEIYKKTSTNIKENIINKDEYLSYIETLDLLIDESKKGNKKALLSVICYFVNLLCVIIGMCIILVHLLV